MRSKGRVVARGALLALVLCAAPAGAAEVEGRILFDGPPPPPETVVVEPKTGIHSTEGCGSLRKDSQKLCVSADGGVKNTVVWIEEEAPTQGASSNLRAVSGPLDGIGHSGTRILDQSRCVFLPHVLAMAAGGSVAIRNSDKTVHNIRIFREGKPDMLMHRWQKVDAADILWRFDEPGRYLVRCGVHPWMYGWVFVAPGPAAAVTDETGRFAIAGVPKGRHTLHLWHETLGIRDVTVSVDSERVELEPISWKGAAHAADH